MRPGSTRNIAAALGALLTLASADAASGQTVRESSAHAALGAERPASLEEGPDALPGAARVGIPGLSAPGLALAAAGGYGFTESVLADSDSHHRFAGSLAVSYRPLAWLAIATRLDGRYDRHSGDEMGSDDGWIGVPRLTARASWEPTPALALGLQLAAWFPTSGFGVDGGAASGDLEGLFAYRASPALTLAARAGARLDRSAASAPDVDMLSRADRLALGVSDSNAALLGIAATYRAGSALLLAEATWDLFLGGDAPAATESPIRLAGGARFALGNGLAAQLHLEASLSGRPPIDVGEPLVPVEPRVAMLAGVIYRFGARAAAPASQQIEIAEPPPPAPGTVRGRLLTATGSPLPGLRVRIGELETTTDAQGRFELSPVPAGEARLEIPAQEPYAAAATTVLVGAEVVATIDVTIEQALPPGQIRGLVRDLSGEPIADAQITIEPGKGTARSAKDGSFVIDVEPGTYRLTVTTAGFQAQTREVRVDENGVTVVNLELRPGGRGQ